MALNPDNLPVVVISGASRGLGKATSDALARQGYHVIMLCRDVRTAAEHALGLSRAGFSVEPRKVDVASSSDVKAVTRHIENEYGRVDVLINNAGIFIEKGEGELADAMSCEDPLRISTTTVMQTLNVNTLGAVRLIQALVPLMPAGGRIINVSSGLGQFGSDGTEIHGNFLGYRMSKSALNMLTCVYADALRARQIQVNAMSPGWVRTDMGGPHGERSIDEGIDTIVWLATSPDADGSGGFYRDRARIPW